MKKLLFALLALCLWSGTSQAAVDIISSTGGSLCTAEHLILPGSNVSCSGNYATYAQTSGMFTGAVTGNTINNTTSDLLTGSSSTVTIDGTLGNIFSVSPTTNMTVSAQNLQPGFYALSIYSTGTSSLSVQFGANIKTTGTSFLTGTTSNKKFAVSFFSDGVLLFENGRQMGVGGGGIN